MWLGSKQALPKTRTSQNEHFPELSTSVCLAQTSDIKYVASTYVLVFYVFWKVLALNLTPKRVSTISVSIKIPFVSPDWPVMYVVYTAVIPSALTGADLAIFAGCFAYIADVTSLKSRTLRVGILDIVYLSAMPSGVAIGMFVLYKAPSCFTRYPVSIGAVADLGFWFGRDDPALSRIW